MVGIDYSKLAEISWVNRPYWDKPGGATIEEYFEEFTLREAVLFATLQLDTRRCKSVTVRCDGRTYNMYEIEILFRSRDFPLDLRDESDRQHRT
jgi:hypothetical protein